MKFLDKVEAHCRNIEQQPKVSLKYVLTLSAVALIMCVVLGSLLGWLVIRLFACF